MRMNAGDVAPGDFLEADLCIVGAGPAGITMALELEGAGLDIILIESGVEEVSKSAQALTAGENADSAYYRLDQTRLRAFGGTSNHWIDTSGMRARPFDAIDFSQRDEIGRPGWPISAEEMEPWYERAQQISFLGPLDYSTDRWERPGSQRWPLGEHGVETAMFQIGPLDSFTRRLDPISARQDIRLILGATVNELITNDAGTRVDRLRVAAGPGRHFGVRARHVVLACGGIDNARLLLLSRQHHQNGLGNGEDQVGRNFMEHPHVRTGTVRLNEQRWMDARDLYEWQTVDGVNVLGMLTLADETLRREELLATAWALHPSDDVLLSPVGRALVDLRELVTYRRVIPGTGERLATLARNPVGAGKAIARAKLGKASSEPVLQMAVMSEQQPNPESRITLSSKRDAFGQQIARLDWKMTDLDKHSIRRGQELIAEALSKAGIGRVESFFGDESPTANIGGGFHHLGTTRMASDSRHGVVDADSRVFGVDNLAVTGTSAFATAGYANPTLTVIALASRLAHRLRKELDTKIDLRAGSDG